MSRQPIIVGVADIRNPSSKLEDAVEPALLMLQAIDKALGDTKLSSTKAAELKRQIDRIDVVRTWTWPYSDLPGLLASKLGCSVKGKFVSHMGGDSPAHHLDEAARSLSAGDYKVAVVTGGEALASLTAFAAAKKLPPPGWTETESNVESVFSPTNRELKETLGARHNIGLPIQVYPLYENGFRAARHQSIKDNNDESAELYAEFAKVAENHEYAWNFGKQADTAQAIGTVTRKNRMICFPYPLLMNAFNTVNLSAACILTTTEYAQELGIPRERWVYPLGGAGTSDHEYFWKRPDLKSSPSISHSIDAALEVSGLRNDQIDLYDFYSCFPIVPKLACRHLGLPLHGGPKPITLLGGLTSFGGAGNNYSLHAITEMTRRLRTGPSTNGLILANGGVLSYQHVICLSSVPRSDGAPYPASPPLPKVLDLPAPEVDETAEGDAVIETYTVQFTRDGEPEDGYIVARMRSNGNRVLANHGDLRTLQQLASRETEPIGRVGRVFPDKEEEGRNLFSFPGESRL